MKELRFNASCEVQGEQATKMSKKFDDFISRLQEKIYGTDFLDSLEPF
jgi:hypothetical protein